MPVSSKERGDSIAESSEKSHNVHSANYKHGEILKKEVQCLNREEKNTVCSITIDQRITATRFRNKLERSVEIMKHHDKIRARFYHNDPKKEPRDRTSPGHSSVGKRKSRNEANGDKARQRPQSGCPLSSSQNFSLKHFTDLGALKNRPHTAVERQSKLWTKRADTAKERVVRAKSAPPSSWRDCEDIVRKLNCGGGGFYAANKFNRPLSRAKFHEVFDNDSYVKFRQYELERQEKRIAAFTESVSELKLVPWYPGPAPKKKEDLSIENVKEDRSKFSGFVTRVDSYI